MDKLQDRLETLVKEMQAAGMADVQGGLPIISVEGTWEGERREISFVVDSPHAVEQFFGSARNAVGKLVCQSRHKRQTWASLQIRPPGGRADELAPCAELGCSQGGGEFQFGWLTVAGQTLVREGEPGSTRWVRATRPTEPQ